MDVLLGIDVGTTSVKAGLFVPDGRSLALDRQEYQLDTPAPDRAQLDPEIYWQACVKTVRAALDQAGIPPAQVKAATVSSQGETTITLDKKGQVIYPAIVWLDNRAVDQAALLAEHFGSEVYARTGIPEIVATWPACKILWLRQNEPEIFSQADKFLLVQDYLIYRMTGRIVTDGSIS
jgi:xylulokinase